MNLTPGVTDLTPPKSPPPSAAMSAADEHAADSATLTTIATREGSPHRFHARVDGGVAYGCGVCGRLNVVRRVNWRWPVHRCDECHTRWRLGLAAFDTLPHPRPRNGWVHPLPPGALYVNTYNNATGQPTIGAVTGTVSFACPACRGITTQRPQRNVVTCRHCQHALGLGLRLWRNPIGRRARTPYDWFFPKELIGATYVLAKERQQDLLAGRPRRRRPRTPSHGLGSTGHLDPRLDGPDAGGAGGRAVGAGDGTDAAAGGPQRPGDVDVYGLG